MAWSRCRRMVLSLITCCLVGSGAAAAATHGSASGYKPGDKLVRGLANVFTGFVEIPRNIYNTTSEEQSLLTGWTVGLGKGLGYTALRMVTGGYEVITFPFQAPKGYQPIVEPEFVWQAPGPKVVK